MRAAASLLIAALTALPSSADWPQFRGPDGDGIAADAPHPVQWGPEQNLAWKVAVPGDGWSSPIVAGEKVFVTTAVETPAEGDDSEPTVSYQLHCLSLATGETLWSRVAAERPPSVPKHKKNTYASETPVTDGERVYVYFGMTGLYCYDFQGNLVWDKQLPAYPMTNDWGTGSSPALDEGRVFLQIDNEQDSHLIAYDAANGEELWRQPRDEKTGWSTPFIWRNSLRTEVIAAGRTARSYDPATGELLWQLNVGAKTSSTPTAAGDLLFLGGKDYRVPGGGIFAVRAGGAGDITPPDGESPTDHIAWFTSETAPGAASPLVYDGLLLVPERRGILSAVDVQTGERLYKERLPNSRVFWASPWVCGNQAFGLNADGETYLFAPGREFAITATNALEDEVWATPAVADGKLLLRGVDFLYCISE
ncbi:MAG: PQQ-binding-like beta-propeller repeat protein [Planctomycetota bacterium]